MAFSFVKAFLSAFKPESAKQGPSLVEYLKQLPEPIEAEARQEAENDFLLSEWEKEDRRRERGEGQEATELKPVSHEEAFLEGGAWVFATRSHHVSAMKYDADAGTLTVQYIRGDTWNYNPISTTLARKFFNDLIDGSPGTDVWSYLRWRPSEGAPDMRAHRPWINAVQVAGPAPD